MKYHRIYVAVDGSKESELALIKAIAVSKRNDHAKIYVLHVLDKSARAHMAEQADPKYIYELGQYANVLQEKNEELLKEAEVPYEFIRLAGVPKQELTKVFKTLKENDLVMCGATGLHSSVERFFFGSVSDSIVRESACDVLIVRTHVPN